MIEIVLIAAAFALAWFAGHVHGVRRCARKNKCLVKQRADVEDWEKEIARQMKYEKIERDKLRTKDK